MAGPVHIPVPVYGSRLGEPQPQPSLASVCREPCPTPHHACHPCHDSERDRNTTTPQHRTTGTPYCNTATSIHHSGKHLTFCCFAMPDVCYPLSLSVLRSLCASSMCQRTRS